MSQVLESRGAGEARGFWKRQPVTRKHSLELRTTGWVPEARAGVLQVCLELPSVAWEEASWLLLCSILNLPPKDLSHC